MRLICFFFSSRRRHTRSLCDWSSDVCSSDLLYATSSTWHIMSGGSTEQQGAGRSDRAQTWCTETSHETLRAQSASRQDSHEYFSCPARHGQPRNRWHLGSFCRAEGRGKQQFARATRRVEHAACAALARSGTTVAGTAL